ncbi:phosphoglycerate mutase-like protein [Amniculicola lignicola CBS 123094]|uniref:Phosphoglycerate mutase-like protein n=1 Tax=Amniculicola lignicola CBS 123094 TaxID=1392246 RepID=A0A6A5X0G7_9PLEO|nr:phosphoglycerate mutase-like protein [Amniculicola lignicola CBS 123094]
MGKPRMIILVRHAQSEGNKNRDIHQFIPDHRVKLTADGWNQADEAGKRLRSMLKPDDTLQFFTSPYRRTRETTEGILRSLTSDDPTPSPFPRHKIKVFEEPRLREQDFGNFQPCSAEMERMWQERADYGHFFYRIPNGESAADAYDRVSGFNESLWRQFGEEDFPSVCVVVTHGMMTRVFLMKWYHWSVEYFEDLRNVNHCEFIVMKQKETNGKFILENELRTWSDLKRRAAVTGSTPTSNKQLPLDASPTTIPTRRWGGCVNGCNHDKINWPRRNMRKNTAEYLGGPLPPAALPTNGSVEEEKDEHQVAPHEIDHAPTINEPTPSKLSRKPSATKAAAIPALPLTPASPNDASDDGSSSDVDDGASSEPEAKPRPQQQSAPRTAAIMRHLQPPPTPGDGFSDDSDYFPGMRHLHGHTHTHTNSSPQKNSPQKSTGSTHSKPRLRASSKQRQQSKERKAARKHSETKWMEESGMGLGARADTLGDADGNVTDDASFLANQARSSSPTGLEPVPGTEGKGILREALKGDMIVEKSDEEREDGDMERSVKGKGEGGVEEVERLKKEEREGFGEIY